MKRILAALLLSTSLPGCTTNKPVQAPLPPAKPTPIPYQRFIPDSPSTNLATPADFALDTKTGQLCKTWKGQLLPVNDQTKGLLALPLCVDLYAKYPDQGDGEGTTGFVPMSDLDKVAIPASIPRASDTQNDSWDFGPNNWIYKVAFVIALGGLFLFVWLVGGFGKRK